jgi:hypothetical protein
VKKIFQKQVTSLNTTIEVIPNPDITLDAITSSISNSSLNPLLKHTINNSSIQLKIATQLDESTTLDLNASISRKNSEGTISFTKKF